MTSLRRRWGKEWSPDAAAGFQQDIEGLLTTELGPTTQLSKLKQVDGVGSGLDADLLDGQDSTYYTDIVARLGYTPLDAANYTALTSWTPTISAQSGTITSYTVHDARYQVIGKQVSIILDFEITNVGTGTVTTLFTLPTAPESTGFQVLYGREVATTGNMVQVPLSLGALTVGIQRYDNAGMIATGYRFAITASYFKP